MKLDIKRTDDRFTIMTNGKLWGTVVVYHNPFHTGHSYLKCSLEPDAVLDPGISRDLFDTIQAEAEHPLQVMLDSRQTEFIAFLKSAGFQCKRKCFEREFSAHACKRPLIEQIPLSIAQADSPAYLQCTRLLYCQYAQKHAAVNPLTAAFDAFCETLPQTVLYETVEGEIINYAFIEDNEIAYVGTICRERYPAFIETVAAQLLSKHTTIAFEADDCDWAAMTLKELFHDPETDSFDTYIR